MNIGIFSLALGERPKPFVEITRPYWEHIAKKHDSEYHTIEEWIKPRSPKRPVPAWQKLLTPEVIPFENFDFIILVDVDVLPHPHLDFSELEQIPEGMIGIVPFEKTEDNCKKFYQQALGKSSLECNKIEHIYNTGFLVWKTRNQEPILDLFKFVWEFGINHMSEQTSLAFEIQNREMDYVLDRKYNTKYCRIMPFPFSFQRIYKQVMATSIIKSLGINIFKLACINKAVKNPKSWHFIGEEYNSLKVLDQVYRTNGLINH